MERHNLSALEVAKFLEAHPKVIKVSHPLLPSSPYRTLASRQNGGRHSGMIAFYLDGGREEAVKFLDRIRIVKRAASLGGTHSLACHPCSLTHAMVISVVEFQFREVRNKKNDPFSNEITFFITIEFLSVGIQSFRNSHP